MSVVLTAAMNSRINSPTQTSLDIRTFLLRGSHSPARSRLQRVRTDPKISYSWDIVARRWRKKTSYGLNTLPVPIFKDGRLHPNGRRDSSSGRNTTGIGHIVSL